MSERYIHYVDSTRVYSCHKCIICQRDIFIMLISLRVYSGHKCTICQRNIFIMLIPLGCIVVIYVQYVREIYSLC